MLYIWLDINVAHHSTFTCPSPPLPPQVVAVSLPVHLNRVVAARNPGRLRRRNVGSISDALPETWPRALAQSLGPETWHRATAYFGLYTMSNRPAMSCGVFGDDMNL